MRSKHILMQLILVFIWIFFMSGSSFASMFNDSDSVKTFIEKYTIIPVLVKGGLVMIPLLCVSVVALGTVIERLVFLAGEQRKRDPNELKRFLDAVSLGDMEQAVHMGEKSNFYAVRMLGYALSHREASLSNAILFAQEEELKRFRRGISVLDTVITLAPLLGLLGTVTGMMGSFSLIGGDLSSPGAITGGIAEALIATAFGLGIAITALIPFNLINTRAEEAKLEMDSAATQLELILQPQIKAKAKLAEADPVQRRLRKGNLS